MQHALYSCNKDNTKCSLPDDATISKGPYNVTITEEFPLEDEPDKSPKRRALRSQPAAGLVAVAAAILIAAGLARRRKMN